VTLLGYVFAFALINLSFLKHALKATSKRTAELILPFEQERVSSLSPE
jgi:hypothetical protein